MKYKDATTGEFKELKIRATDELPVGSEIDVADNTTIPAGWEEVDDPNVYSTTEKVIGKWITGKPLYRKTFNVGTLPNAGSKSFETDLDWSICKTTNISGCAIHPTGGSLPLNFANSLAAGEMIGCRQTGTNKITIYTGADRSSYTGYVTLEYTKTTD